MLNFYLLKNVMLINIIPLKTPSCIHMYKKLQIFPYTIGKIYAAVVSVYWEQLPLFQIWTEKLRRFRSFENFRNTKKTRFFQMSMLGNQIAFRKRPFYVYIHTPKIFWRNQCCKWLREALQESLCEAKVGGICLPDNLGFDETSVLTLRSGGISVQIRR